MNSTKPKFTTPIFQLSYDQFWLKKFNKKPYNIKISMNV